MILTGLTDSNEYELNSALLNVSHKLRISLWEANLVKTKSLSDTPIADRVDILITLCNKLYKR